MNDQAAIRYQEAYREYYAKFLLLEEALEQIAWLPYVTEESPWTWKDICERQTEIAKEALDKCKQ